jgi:hypothetical protein
MKALLVALVLLSLAPDALDAALRGARHEPLTGRRVRVFDYTSPDWDGIVAAAVAGTNGILPPRAPRLEYRRMAEKPCSGLKPRAHRSNVLVCSAPDLDAQAGATDPHHRWRDGRLERVGARVSLDDGLHAVLGWRRPNTVCHELMHAVLAVRDRYDSRPGTSCVRGDLDAPGPWDAAYARRAYRKHR